MTLQSVHHNPILAQFSPLQRQGLLRWLSTSGSSHLCNKAFHRAFRHGLKEVGYTFKSRLLLDRRTKIAFILGHEFGDRFKPVSGNELLINQVEQLLRRKAYRQTPPMNS